MTISNSFVVANAPGNDLLPFACQMKYAELTPWTTFQSIDDDSDDFTTDYQSRGCRQSKLTEDEPLACEGPVTREIKLYWMRDNEPWDLAAETCANLSLELFFRFDGTDQQLERFSRKLGLNGGTPLFWTGVYHDTELGYVNMNGQNMDHMTDTVDYISESPPNPWIASKDGLSITQGRSAHEPFVCYHETYP